MAEGAAGDGAPSGRGVARAGELDELVPLREEAESWLLKEAKAHPIIKTLSTAPGMGPLRTAQMVAIVITPHRFRTRRQFWSYCGLAIVTRSSSDWIPGQNGKWTRAVVRQTRGLNRKRHPVLKLVFKGAATTVITQLHGHPLHMDYERMLQSGYQAEPGQAHPGPSDRRDRTVDVEARGGVRPRAPQACDGQELAAGVGEVDRDSWSFGECARERLEGEHPLVSWSSGHDGEIPNAGYAPSEYRLKQWPNKALSGAWCPRFSGGAIGFEIERVTEQPFHPAPSRTSFPPISIVTIGAWPAPRSYRIHRSPVAGVGAGARVNFSLDNSFLRS